MRSCYASSRDGKGAPVRLQVNGQDREFPEGLSLEGLIQELGVRKETVVAEVNRRIVQGEQRASCRLADGDQVELIQFVGGG